MDPSTMAALGAGGGLLKTYLVDKPQADRDRYMAAITARYSPWTHMQPGQVQQVNPFNNIVQGGAAGMGMGQSMQNNDTWNQLMQAQMAKGGGTAGASGAQLSGMPMSAASGAMLA